MDDNKEFLEKDVLSTLPLAPGGVYSVKWEARRKLSKQIDVDPIAYETPYPINLSNPFCFLELRSGGYYLGRVVVELKADICPITCQNFQQLCEYKCYTGSMMAVWPGTKLQGGDFTERDPLVWDPEDPECFDFDNLLPGAPSGGQSVFEEPYFADENFDLSHSGAGVLTMANAGPNTNGSKFIITMRSLKEMDGVNVAFGQVVEGFDVVWALSKVGRPDQDGTTSQRVTIEGCGLLPSDFKPAANLQPPPPISAKMQATSLSRTAFIRTVRIADHLNSRLVVRADRLGSRVLVMQSKAHKHLIVPSRKATPSNLGQFTVSKLPRAQTLTVVP
mmetsp:Transcript_31927/g.61441  ORF Transcript_31927/g.61441 Transcript_31927/m.61441 type:complete len:333 (+) Transcript_31927:94-1092(+)|eukprot:CAMPEP_0114251120 /NCGR_PEP_ID=MMETSP0058-20121206/15094_1 /TAXON_ID=36894 /ORGANISM="Pyramimonas parkeae, CCMP726" /LENGTH=332 /DNA_ID=CAMNT_0001364887 /DNA_START=93 /DNA_END=1091 /DNA_ORIENTATION=+